MNYFLFFIDFYYTYVYGARENQPQPKTPYVERGRNILFLSYLWNIPA